MFSGLVEISSFGHLILLLCMFRAGFTSRTSAKQTLAIFFFGGADLCVSAVSFSFSALFCFIARFFFPGCDFCLLFFSGLNSCPGRTPNGLRTNFGLKLFLELICFSVLNFLVLVVQEHWNYSLLMRLFVQIQCYQGKHKH